MAILNIVKIEDEILRQKSKPIDKITPRITQLIDDMRETLKKAGGVGLAAVQVGVLRRVVLVENDDGEVWELINPEIISEEGEQEDLEGCLSIPNQWGFTHRPATVTVKAQDRYGNEITVSGTGLTARALCHELDHLEGVLFIDKVDRILSDEELKELME